MSSFTLADYIQERVPGHVHQKGDRTTIYWIRDGRVQWGREPIRGADVDSFRFYLGSFAKDARHCYCQNSRLKDANAETFHALNYTYFSDGRKVWTLGGAIKDVDAESFVVCDDGVHELGNLLIPQGFGKDRSRVYYYDFDGKPNWVRKAIAASFVSLGDGYFGKDRTSVFCGAYPLPRVNVSQWQKIGSYCSHYSKDDQRVYYLNRLMAGADVESFRFVPSQHNVAQLAQDKNRLYDCDQPTTSERFLKWAVPEAW